MPNLSPVEVSRGALGVAEGAGDAEIGHQRVAAGEHDVLGLDVAMDHTLAVGILERLGDLAADAHRLLEREAFLALQPLPE